MKKGQKHSKETKRKMSIAHTGHKCLYHKGHKLSEETKKKIGLANSIALKGNIPWNKGLTKELDSRIDYERPTSYKKGNIPWSKGRKEKLSPAWKGGVSRKPYNYYFNSELKEIIKKRDNYTCQLCGVKKNLSVHHIDYNKMNSNEENLITLCKKCNSEVNYQRAFWTGCFVRRMSIIIERKLI